LYKGKHKQAGAALIMAMMIMTITAGLAYFMLIQQQTTIERSQLLFGTDRAYLHSNGALAWAKFLLAEEALDDPDQQFFYPAILEPSTTPDNSGTVMARLDDLQGRFNLNNFIWDESFGETSHRFRLLLQAVSPDLSEQEINTLIDAITMRLNTMMPQQRLFTDVSELRPLEGMTAALYRLLLPHISALGEPTAVNINSATLPVLMSLGNGISAADAEQLINYRQSTGFESAEDFLSHPIMEQREINSGDITLDSNYFLLRADVALAQQRLTVYTLLQRAFLNQRPFVRTVWQSVGE